MIEVKKSNIFGDPMMGILMNSTDPHSDKRVGERQRYLGGVNNSSEESGANRVSKNGDQYLGAR